MDSRIHTIRRAERTVYYIFTASTGLVESTDLAHLTRILDAVDGYGRLEACQ